MKKILAIAILSIMAMFVVSQHKSQAQQVNFDSMGHCSDPDNTGCPGNAPCDHGRCVPPPK